MDNKKTRSSQRTKKISQNLRTVDHETRQFVMQQKIDALESDYYDSPNRLAEDQDSADDIDFIDEETKQKNKKYIQKLQKIKKKINKKNRKDCYVKKNFNLKKLLKEDYQADNQEEIQLPFPNFLNVRSKANTTGPVPIRKLCSICGNVSKYCCPRCGERYCSIKCNKIHKEVKCLKFEM